ncbi:MAG TPA: IS630 family transposase [Ktedonobacteraceae bacterium]|nr:IS630 family transposase [Ktedonobacteraceae bacterium]
MPKHLHLDLTDAQRQELVWHRDHAPKPLIRERCAALLMIAEEDSPAHVARSRLYRRREPDTVYRWRSRYLEGGLAGLQTRPGRGRKPAFSPRYHEAEQAKEALLHVVRRDPHQLGGARSRWTLNTLLPHLDWLEVQTSSGLWQVLDRLGIHYKRGRTYVHPAYEEELARIEALKRLVQAHPEERVLLYQDECTLYRQPSVSYAYEAAGSDRRYARQAQQLNNVTRLVATLDALTGRVVVKSWSKVGTKQMASFHQLVRQAYPDARRIWIIQDNWPLHFHPDVLLALQAQERLYPVKQPRNWTTVPTQEARKQCGAWHLPIRIVRLPTYASWYNPIEKLWRKLKQDLFHLHPWADDLSTLRQHLLNFFQPFEVGSQDLLHYVGLHLPY